MGWWFDGGGNGKIYSKGMNVVRQDCEHFSSMGSDSMETLQGKLKDLKLQTVW